MSKNIIESVLVKEYGPMREAGHVVAQVSATGCPMAPF